MRDREIQTTAVDHYSQTVDEKNKHLASEDCEQPRKTVRDFEKDRETL
jgi:hypothetical protein